MKWNYYGATSHDTAQVMTQWSRRPRRASAAARLPGPAGSNHAEGMKVCSECGVFVR
jgi:hypothetical protein